jgi:DNA-binding PadR family transcriptional regulator
MLQVEHGSLYPALHRLEDKKWIVSFGAILKQTAGPGTTG